MCMTTLLRLLETLYRLLDCHRHHNLTILAAIRGRSTWETMISIATSQLVRVRRFKSDERWTGRSTSTTRKPIATGNALMRQTIGIEIIAGTSRRRRRGWRRWVMIVNKGTERQGTISCLDPPSYRQWLRRDCTHISHATRGEQIIIMAKARKRSSSVARAERGGLNKQCVSRRGGSQGAANRNCRNVTRQSLCLHSAVVCTDQQFARLPRGNLVDLPLAAIGIVLALSTHTHSK